MTDGHTSATCQLPINCYHCREPHEVSSKTCPRYLLEKEILTIKTKEHLSFSEARSKVILTLPAGGRSFASAARQNAPRTNRTQDINNNSQQPTPIIDETTKSSKKRPLQRTESTSPEKSQPKEKRRTYNQSPTTTDSLQTPLETHNRHEPMETTIPPDFVSSTKRNSAPDIIINSQIEQELLNTMRKTSKDKNRKKEKEAPNQQKQPTRLPK